MKIKDTSGQSFYMHNGHAKQRLDERLSGEIPKLIKKPASHLDFKKAERGEPYNFHLQSADGAVQVPLVRVGKRLFVKTFIAK